VNNLSMNRLFATSNHVAQSRRDFLRRTACSSLACATSGALFGQLSLMNSLLAACPSYPPVDDYRALVCLFLVGGNDSFNLLIPTDTARYNTYNTSRSGPAPAGMAIDKAALIPVHPATLDQAGDTYGMHPSCPELAALFESGKLAFVVNAGTALQPTAKANYQTPGYPFRRNCSRMPTNKGNGSSASRRRTARSVGRAWLPTA